MEEGDANLHQDKSQEEQIDVNAVIEELIKPRFSEVERIRPVKKPIKMKPFDSTFSCEASVNALNALITRIELENI